MTLTRDSMLWTMTLVAALAVFLSGHFSLLTDAFPGLGAVWQARIELVAALTGFVAGYLKMSPLALAPQNPMAGTADPSNTLTTLGQPKPPEGDSK